MTTQHLTLFDGAMGTMLHHHGLTHLSVPEELNLTSPEIIKSIHKSYLASGADVITTHTFGANAFKLSLSSYTVSEIVHAAVTNARKAAKGTTARIALDIGPIGRLLKPVGDLDFDEAYALFREQVIAGRDAGADLILIETMSDLGEMRAAILAAKEHTDCPIYATMTFEEDGTTLTGTDPENMVLALEALGVDALGVNCSLGPAQLLPIVRRILAFSTLPVMVQANAGLPVIIDGETRYTVSEEDYARHARIFAEEGVAIIGGCCGTTPLYIEKLQSARDLYKPRPATSHKAYLSSSQKRVPLDGQITVIGERINPSGNRTLKPAFKSGDVAPALRLAFEQIDAGAHVLDISTDLPGIDAIGLMTKLIDQMNGVVSAPLQFDSTDPHLLEAALRRYNGVAIINSVNAKPESMAQLFPLMKRYGAYAVALTMDENGIPKTATQRLAVARKFIRKAEKFGLDKDRFLFDPLVLTASAQQAAVSETLEGIRLLTEKLHVRTTLGLSNVSYGLPSRALLNQTYLAMALTYGLTSVIIDPGAPGVRETLMAYNVLSNRDQDATAFIEAFGQQVENPHPAHPRQMTLKEALLKGDKASVELLITPLLERHDPLWVVENHLVKALDQIGQDYESKKIFLPQLIRAADTAGHAFALVKKELDRSNRTLESRGTIALATVKGDVHDLGKNLVKVLLENYGFTVVDLGKDVGIETLVKAISDQNIRMVGLSALMTTTVNNMAETIRELRSHFDNLYIFVGGAVLTEDHALRIGADAYGKDAKAAVSIARNFCD